VNVYIDGENCRKGLARVLEASGSVAHSRDMKSYKLRELLADALVLPDQAALSINYYASEIRMPNGYTPSPDILSHVQAIKNYNRAWVNSLKSQNINYIKAGYLKVKTSKECRNCHTSQDILQEKGVDVRLAGDMLEAAYEAKVDTIILMSSDTDLCPILHKIKNQGIKIIYICLADSINRAVSAVADQTVTIPIPKVQQFVS
jgi:uncharacterized LabA/DUF88 family protein